MPPVTTTPMSMHAPVGRHQRGLSLVELMVGVAIGLIVVAAASLMLGTQLADNRRLLLETQLQQDLRATMDIIARQLRRASALQPGQSQQLLAKDDGTFGARNMAFLPVSQPAPDHLEITYFRDADNLSFGFRLQGGVIRSQLGDLGAWQDLTDPAALRVTQLRFEPNHRVTGVIPCARECPGGGRACWPTVQVRSWRVTLQAESPTDASVRRQLQSEVRVRNDFLQFNTGVAGQACPP